MKICALTHTYPRFPDDINAPFVEKLMEHIARKGNDVSVLTAYDLLWNRKNGDHTVDLRTYRYIWPDRLHILGYSRTIEGNIRFRKRVLLLAPFLCMAAFRAFLRLVKEKKPDVLHAHWIVPNGFIAGFVSQLTGIPLLIQTHGSDVFIAEKNAVFRSMARFAASSARYIASPSPDIIKRLVQIGIDARKIGLVPNTVERNFTEGITPDDSRRLKNELGIPENNLVVLAMGRMVHVKGFEFLLEAFKRITAARDDVTLVLAGDGVLFETMKNIAETFGSGRVVMPGAVMRHAVPVYFTMADIFVVPSIRHESGAVDGLPVVVPEAMAAALPVIASNVGGIPVLIKNGYNGTLVREKDVNGIAEAIEDLLNNPERRKLFGERSRRIIDSGVNYTTVTDYFCLLYRNIILHTSAEKIPPFMIPME
jgi:glycosyltransferase involved in cell wall biosynthesis